MNIDELKEIVDGIEIFLIQDYNYDQKGINTIRIVKLYDYGDVLKTDERTIEIALFDIEKTVASVQNYVNDFYKNENYNITVEDVKPVLENMLEFYKDKNTITDEKLHIKHDDREIINSSLYVKDGCLYINAIDTHVPMKEPKKRKKLETIIKDCIKLSLLTTNIRRFKIDLDEWEFGKTTLTHDDPVVSECIMLTRK